MARRGSVKKRSPTQFPADEHFKEAHNPPEAD